MKSPPKVPVIGKILLNPSANLPDKDGSALAVNRDAKTFVDTRDISYSDKAQACVYEAYNQGIQEERQRIMMMMSACAEGAPDAQDRASMRKLVDDMQRRVGMEHA